jgi:hypothetical protein
LLGVISKIKQNSSDMNEIILAPCDAGYVQNCTGLCTFCPLYRPDQGNIVGRKYIKNSMAIRYISPRFNNIHH